MAEAKSSNSASQNPTLSLLALPWFASILRQALASWPLSGVSGLNTILSGTSVGKYRTFLP